MLVLEVTDNKSRQRFETIVNGKPAFVNYAIRNGRLELIHTFVAHDLRGHGVGRVLVRSVLEIARARRMKIVPKCEFVQKYLSRNPEFADVVAEGRE